MTKRERDIKSTSIKIKSHNFLSAWGLKIRLLPRIYRYPLPIETRLPVSPARPGAFNANFAPDTLEAFKALCRQQGKQYTKVLEQFAEIYLKTSGSVLDQMSVPSMEEASDTIPASSSISNRRSTIEDLLDRVTTIESTEQEFVSAFEMLIHRIDALEGQVTCKDLEKRVGHLEKAVQYRQEKSKN